LLRQFASLGSRFALYLLFHCILQKDAATIRAISFASSQKKQKELSFVLTRGEAELSEAIQKVLC